MEYVIAVCGFLGGWLLFAGPIWQATIELQEEELDQDAFHRVQKAIPPSDPVSRWWLILPPVYWVKLRRRSSEYRTAVMKALPDEQVEQTINFLNKANGWFIVAGGAFLIAVKETWESASCSTGRCGSSSRWSSSPRRSGS